MTSQQKGKKTILPYKLDQMLVLLQDLISKDDGEKKHVPKLLR